MNRLAAPDKDLIVRILSQVGFKDRLTGYRAGERSGSARVSLYSFQEIAVFLGNPFPQLAFVDLEEWIRQVMGDVELGMRISEVVKEESNDYDRTQRIKVLMEERLAQCMKAASA
jgi:hypothetical protein